LLAVFTLAAYSSKTGGTSPRPPTGEAIAGHIRVWDGAHPSVGQWGKIEINFAKFLAMILDERRAIKNALVSNFYGKHRIMG